MTYWYSEGATLIAGLNNEKSKIHICTQLRLEDGSLLFIGADSDNESVFSWQKLH